MKNNFKKPFYELILVVLIIAVIIGGNYFYKICYKNHYLTIAAPVNIRDGMGKQAVDLMYLLKEDVDMNLISSYQAYVPSDLKKFIKNSNKKLGYVVINEHSLLQANIPDELYRQKWLLSKKYKYRNSFNVIPRNEQIFINYSMFEADMLPEDSVFYLNKNWDMIVLPDQNLVEIYKKSGVTKPIFVVPLGTDLDTHLQAPLKVKRNEIFKFASFSIFEERKNLLKLVQAYHQAFKDNDQVRLLLSGRGDRGGVFKQVLQYVIDNKVQGVEIDSLDGKEKEYFDFIYGRIDCYVSPSKGEGFSIIPREIMARGIPLIASDAIAQKTLTDTGLVRVVHADKLVPGDYTFIKRVIGNFVDIEVSDLADAMLDVYNNYQTYLDKAPEARAWAEKGQYKNLKEEYLNMVKPKKIILGDKNEITKDYLMTDSQELYNKWKHLEEIGVLKQ